MRNQSKASNCGPHHRVRVVLDEAEIQRRMSKPKRRTLAECYAEATEAAERERWYSKEAPHQGDSTSNMRPSGRPTLTVWVTKPILKTRGWTDAAIREFLPKPERTMGNPHPEARRRMPLWRAETVANAESDPEWQHWLRQSLNRRRLTLDDLLDATDDRAFLQRARRAATAIDAHRRSRS